MVKRHRALNPLAVALVVFGMIAVWLRVPASAQLQRKTAVFVGPQVRDGFVDIDHGVMDSIKDLQGELRDRKGIEVVTEKERSQIVIEVISRGSTSTSGGGAAAVPIGTSTFFIPMGTIGIATVLRVGAYEKPIVFQNCQAWKYCARLVSKDIEAWVEANRTQIPPR